MSKEVIDFVVEQNLGFNLGNAVQLICQANESGGDDTLDKLLVATSHIEHYIERNARDAVLKKVFALCSSVYVSGGCKYCPIFELFGTNKSGTCRTYVEQNPHEALALLGGGKKL